MLESTSHLSLLKLIGLWIKLFVNAYKTRLMYDSKDKLVAVRPRDYTSVFYLYLRQQCGTVLILVPSGLKLISDDVPYYTTTNTTDTRGYWILEAVAGHNYITTRGNKHLIQNR